MPIEARRMYLVAIRERYKKANRREKKLILDEFCQVCGYNRKHAISIINHPHLKSAFVKPGPKKKYDETLGHHLHALWLAMDHICSKKMKYALPQWLKFYPLADEETKRLLCLISPSTIDRILKPYRKKRGLSATRSVKFKNKIPIELIYGYVTEPGHVEADTVAHCGDSLGGEFVSTLTVTDLATGWTENRAIFGKTGAAIVHVMRDIEHSVPFKLKGFASDNGSEFINGDVEKFLKQRELPVHWVRRRPYRKNDSAHVEQKNWTHVREIFGYDRFENFNLSVKMSEIYRHHWNPLLNYFIPVFKLHSKDRIGSKIKKVYDQPKTPYQRLLDSGHLSDDQSRSLKEKMQTLNPFELKRTLEEKLSSFWSFADKVKVRDNRTPWS